MGKIKKILENELVGGTQTTDVYPVTSIKAVYDENNERLDHILDTKEDIANKVTDYLTANNAIEELYIDTPGEYQFTLLTALESRVQIIIKNKDGKIVCYVSKSGSPVLHNIFEIPQYEDSGITAYIIFKDYITTSRIINIDSNRIQLRYNKSIQQYYVLNNKTLIEEHLKVKKPTLWCTYSYFNEVIEELYIPNLVKKYGEGCCITRVYATESRMRLFIQQSDKSTYVCVDGKDTTLDYYKSGAITPLLDYRTHEIIGYVKLKYNGTDYEKDYDNAVINSELVEDINNSPSIKQSLESDEQILLLGDSLLGQPWDNAMADMLRGYTGKKVVNIACSGCCMAWRSEGGSDYYDKFTFVSLVDAMCSGDFTLQDEAIANRTSSQIDYSYQVLKAKTIDLSKPTTIICNYINNDVTTNVQLGELWANGNTLEDYDKNTFCGAHSYGCHKLLTQYPHIKIVFISDSYRFRKQNGTGDLVPPYLYENGIGIKATDYSTKLFENCERMGLRHYDFNEYGVRNAFSMNYSTVDGTHCNGYGFAEFAKYLLRIYKEFNV